MPYSNTKALEKQRKKLKSLQQSDFQVIKRAKVAKTNE